ncbi:hypothetical protein D3C73_1662950 [compost metagenome]
MAHLKHRQLAGDVHIVNTHGQARLHERPCRGRKRPGTIEHDSDVVQSAHGIFQGEHPIFDA